MSEQNLAILYSFRRCPYAMRARLALYASKINYEHREVVLRNKPPQLLQASPKGTVPVFITNGGEVIDESLDIMLWAAKNHDPMDLLFKSNPNACQSMLDLINQSDNQFKPLLDRYKYPNRYDLESGEPARDEAVIWLNKLDDMLNKHDYLFDEKIKLADFAIAPFVRQFAHVDKDWFFSQNWQNLIRWLNNFLESDIFENIMQKHKPWQGY